MYFIGHKQSYGSFDTGLFDLSTLLPFYRNFMFMGPSWLDLPTLKSTLYSAIFIGLFCLATLLLTDFLITLYYKYFTT